VYTREQADRLAKERGWAMAPDNDKFRRVVPLPLPKHIFEIKVIDKDRAGALLAQELGADAYLMLTDVKAVYTNWGKPDARAIRRTSPDAIEALTFAAGSMGPKVEAACDFVRKTGGIAGIGSL
jgi:carbamate kinase